MLVGYMNRFHVTSWTLRYKTTTD
ncbi:hypothetical protein Goklo_024132 [Gossypium klotzschianum]|uniref:Uncharacterized protein n=1 Tax=Gossypium klotzschianum TaxID=34286 RepID=A0A7J8W6F5_9ROSI|nr:hypothetical protein [Gossypium klotzschianum]